MKDIPMFTSEFGVASLILREIPYQKKAYIRIRASQDLERLLRECEMFCRMVGAEEIFASGHEGLEKYPVYTDIIKMSVCKKDLPSTNAATEPVIDVTAGRFCDIYNDKVIHIPNAAWMDKTDLRDMMERKEGYYVRKGDSIIGIGRVYGNELRFLAALEPGAGADTVIALSGLAEAEIITLEVATANEKAISLYMRLGFAQEQHLSRWYRVL